jgi:hypothetical protein
MTITWSPQTALDRLSTEHRLQEILQVEPRLQALLDQAIYQEAGPTYDRIRTYTKLRNQLIPLVGWHAEHPALRNSGDYQLVLEVLIDLLPPDRLDLNYPPPPPYRRYPI